MSVDGDEGSVGEDPTKQTTAITPKTKKKDKKKKMKKHHHKHKDKKHKKDKKEEEDFTTLHETTDIELERASTTKRKRSEDHDDDDDDDVVVVDSEKEEEEKKSKKKKKRKKEKAGGVEIANSTVATAPVAPAAATTTTSSTSERLVCSSAIEFYDDSLKERVKTKEKTTEKKKKKKKKAKKKMMNKESGGDNNSDDGDSKSKDLKAETDDEMTSRSSNGGDKKDDNRELQKKQLMINKMIKEKQRSHSLTLLLFYQYVEPKWDQSTYDYMLSTLQRIGNDLKLTGRMRVANEGLNCTLTGSHESIVEYCNTLRRLRPPSSESTTSAGTEDNNNNNNHKKKTKQPPKYPFENTEFKLTTDLPEAQRFPNLKVFKVVELVHYGLEGKKAPPIHRYHGEHLEPADYHKKIAEPNTVIIDVRNHYEAAIGRFVPPQEEEAAKAASTEGGNVPKTDSTTADGQLPPPKWLDPKMRKSTEFPQWLDRPETKDEMKGKQVLMYCTGGIRCERASALLKYKMETDPEIKALGIKGVYQLQGGIDKYFKEFPDGGHWRGKNYVFDKRFAHAPPKVDGELHGRQKKPDNIDDSEEKKDGNDAQPTTAKSSGELPALKIMGKCEACARPWDMYRGKRRCPSCGVPSLICKDCFLADKEGRKKLGRDVRCDLCVEQGIFSKRDIRAKDEEAIKAYEEKMKAKGLLQPEKVPAIPENPGRITRLLLKNMCRKKMTEETLLETFPQISHIVWKTDRKSGNFLGSAWVEMKTPDDAALAVAQDNKLRVFGRPMGISFAPPNPKDVWPPPSSRVA